MILSSLVPWSVEETVLLIDIYQKVKIGEINRQDTIDTLSYTLRNFALKNGNQIDDNYRSRTDIIKHFLEIQGLFEETLSNKSNISPLFIRMVEIYKKFRSVFDNTLQRSLKLFGIKKENNGKSTEKESISFEDYLNNNFDLFETRANILSDLRTIGNYFKKTNVINQSLLNIQDMDILIKMNSIVERSQLFKMLNKSKYDNLLSSWRIFYSFVNGDYKNEQDEKKEVTKQQESLSTASESNNRTLLKQPPQLLPDSPLTKEEVSSFVKEEQTNNLNIKSFSFDQIPDLTFTKVKSYKLFEYEEKVAQWNTFYVSVVRDLCKDHLSIIKQLVNKSITNANRIDFGNDKSYLTMSAPKYIKQDLYVETKLDANTIAKKLQRLLDICGISRSKLTVYYYSENKEENLLKINSNKIATIENTGIKAKKVPWSEEETALLIETYQNITSGKIKRSDAIRELSETLRNNAIRQGKEIDDIFRNTNGINMCLTQIKTLFEGSNGGLSNISSMFIRMVDLYKNDRYSFDKYLNSAKESLNSSNQFEKDDGIKDYEEADKDSNESVEENYDDEVCGNDNYVSEHDSDKGEAFEEEETIESPKLPTDINRIISFEEYLSLTKTNYCIKEKIYQLSLNYSNDVSQIIGFSKYDKISMLYSSLLFASRLILNEDLIRANSSSIVELFEAIGCYVKYLGYLKEIEQNIKEQENNYNCYRNIFLKFFNTGIRLDPIDINKFKNKYKEEYNQEISVSNDELKHNIENITIKFNNRFYLPDNLLDQDTQNLLLSDINELFNQGKQVYFYTSIFNKFKDILIRNHINDEKMLKKYLSYVYENIYHNLDSIDDDYIHSKTFNRSYDISSDIKEFLIENHIPQTKENILKKLYYIDSDKIEQKLNINKEKDFILNLKKNDNQSEYFYITTCEITNEELKIISDLIRNELDNKGYLTDEELYNLLNQALPDVISRNEQISKLGWRKVAEYYFNNYFDFNRKIISRNGCGIKDLFVGYAKQNKFFTTTQLKNFSNELDIRVPYYSDVFKYSIRINANDYVSKDCIDFYLKRDAIDSAIELYFNNKLYISLDYINIFTSFPNIGYTWNSYILENYVYCYSKIFTLINASFSDKPIGAIVRKEAGINSFSDLIVRILSDTHKEYTEDEAFDYLISHGYLYTKRFSNMSECVNQSNVIVKQRRF